MKKKLIWILVLTLAVIMTVVGTVAYFSATDAVKNAVAVGNASIELVEFERANVNDNNTDNVVPFKEANKLLLPSIVSDGFNYKTLKGKVNWKDEKGGEMNVGGNKSYTSSIWNPANINNELDKMVFVRNTGNTEVYVRVCFAFEAGNYVYKSHFDRMVHLNLNDEDWTWSWKNDVVEINGTRYFIAWATYDKTLPGQQYTEISLSQIALDSSAIGDHAKAFGDKYDVLVFAQGIQVEGMGDDAAAALNKGFTDAYPFGDVKEVNFVDLKTALHYLNGEISEENKITKKVKNITFGLTGDYPEVVNAYDGVSVANEESGVDNEGNVTTPEADFTAYAYYVPTSDGKYDIYVLADNWKIYAPNNSGSLFDIMEFLVKVDTSNLDVSYATNMFKMFHDCWELAEIDVSHWVVDNVTNMAYMFQVCKVLPELDCSNWNVSNVTNMEMMFNRCNNLKTLDASNWDVSKVTNMQYMFSQDGNLENLNISGWHFGDDNTVKVTNMDSMFNGCSKLEYIDVANWNVSKVTNMAGTFVDCTALKSLDVSRWNVGNVTTMFQMFRDCENLASVDVSEWNVNVTNDVRMAEMFFNMSKLTKLDLSNWNTEKVIDSSSMFNNCVNLKTIYVGGGWTVANVTSSGDMFKNCNNLVGGEGTTIAKLDAIEGIEDTNLINKTYARVDEGIVDDENGNKDTTKAGYLTYKAP